MEKVIEKLKPIYKEIRRRFKQPSTKVGAVVLVALILILFTNVTPEDITSLTNNITVMVAAIIALLAAVYDMVREEKIDEEDTE